MSRRDSVGQTVANDAVQRVETVAPTDLLSFVVAATVVSDRHFGETHLAASQFSRDFRLETRGGITIIILYACTRVSIWL